MRAHRRWFVAGAMAVGVCAAYAQGPGNFDPARDWQRRSARMVSEMHAGFAAGERKARVDWDIAAEQRRLDLANAAHERATQLCLASEVYRQSAHDPNSRQVYIQAVVTAGQQYQQAVGTAYQTWANSTSQAFQQWVQNGGQTLQSAQNELGQAIQPFAQNMPAFEKEPAATTPSDWLLPESAGGEGSAASEKVFADSLGQAQAKYAAALNEAGAAWKKSVDQTAQQRANKEMADELAAGQFRKANRQWQAAAMDALDELRAAARSALRKYEAAAMPE